MENLKKIWKNKMLIFHDNGDNKYTIDDLTQCAENK